MQGKLLHFTHFHLFQSLNGDMQFVSIYQQKYKGHTQEN